MISGHGNIETAVAAIKRGAYDFIEKPFKADRLVLVANRALETSRLKREVRSSSSSRRADQPDRQFIGDQPAAPGDRQGRADQQPHPDLGPSGSGKELVARTIHTASARADGPFVVINAAA